MKRFLVIIFILALAACAKKDEAGEEQLRSIAPTSIAANTSDPGQVADELLQDHKFFQYPEVTLNIQSKDIQKSIKLVLAAGGRIVYDPNFGAGSIISFAIVTIPPAKVADKKFFSSLELTRVDIENGNSYLVSPVYGVQERNLFVPKQEVKLNELQYNGSADGRGTIIAVVDTGVDAFHPAFQDRVVYWADHTQETRTKLEKIQDANFSKQLNFFAEGFLTAKISESALAVQLSDSERQNKKPGLDLNLNGSTDDEFRIFVGKLASGVWAAVVDADGDGKISLEEQNNLIGDFNEVRAKFCGKPIAGVEPLRDFIQFPSRTRTIKYPLLLERSSDGTPLAISLGIDARDHGTHVAGIAAGNWESIQGAAPQAKIMSLKVCSGISCTSQAINRALVDAFYNNRGCLPDVVNMSLGSLERAEDRAVNSLIRDLIAKFGAAFVISASNNGPGFRSLNGMGSIGAAMLVGASVSKETLAKHYNTNETTTSTPAHATFGFSSLGPSFAGYLRPNFVAPGSALSSTPLRSMGASMMNGTSMSAPLASGAIAALLSLVKQTDEGKKFYNTRELKIKSLSGMNQSSSFSLTGFALALRSALEESAQKLVNHSDAQQGFGLLNISNGYQLFMSKLANLNRDLGSYVDLQVGLENNKAEKYNRSLDIPTRMDFSFTVRDDGEWSERDLIKFRMRDHLVKLEYVQEVSPQNQIQILNGEELPFSIMVPGVNPQNGKFATIVPLNPVASGFQSLRKLKMMKPGFTYIAHYGIYVNNQRQLSLNDVVHMPLQLPEARTELNLHSIQANAVDKPAALGFANVAISTNQIHRYFIAVTERDQLIQFRLNLNPNMNGGLVAALYDPNGKEVATATSARRPDLNSAAAAVAKHTVLMPGIYEITIGTTGARWMADAAYDLLIESMRTRISHQELVIKSGEEKLFNVSYNSKQFKKIDLGFSENRVVDFQKNVKVEAGKWTFKRIRQPEGFDPKNLSTVQILLNKNFVEEGEFNGRVDNQLYTLSSDGKEFVALPYKLMPGSSAISKTFSDVNWDKPIYYAIETYDFRPKDVYTNAVVEVHFLNAQLTNLLSVERMKDTGADTAIFKVKVTDSKWDAFGVLTFTQDQSEFPSLTIPVRVLKK